MGLSQFNVTKTRLNTKAKPKQLKKWKAVDDERCGANLCQPQAKASAKASTCSQWPRYISVLLLFENNVATTHFVLNNQEIVIGNKGESSGVYIHWASVT